MNVDFGERELCALCAGQTVEALDAAGVPGCGCSNACDCSQDQGCGYGSEPGAQPAREVANAPRGWWERAML